MKDPVVMIVDDDLDFREMIRDFLSGRGFSVIGAGSGSEAMSIASSTPPDVVFLDIMMPIQDGYEVCRNMRASNTTRAATIIMLTVRDKLSDKLTAYIAGAHRFLSKTCELEEIHQCLDRVLVQRGIGSMKNSNYLSAD